jgi:tetratricopeptide (TPR) repeat protein
MDGLLDALQQDIDFFQRSVIQQLDDVKDSNRLEHAITRTQLSTNHQETIETIKTEQQSSQLLSAKEAGDTRNHVSEEHIETRAEVSIGNDNLQQLITLGQERAAEYSELQHTGTRKIVVDSVIDQNAATEYSLKDDSQQKIDFLEAELFRIQLENESNVRSEHALTRQELQRIDSRGYAKAIMRQSQAILEEAIALRREQHQITGRGTNIDAHHNSSLVSSDSQPVNGKASMLEAHDCVSKSHSIERNTSAPGEHDTTENQNESPIPTPRHGEERHWSRKESSFRCSFEETIAGSRLSRAEKNVLPKLALLWLLNPEIEPESQECKQAYQGDCVIFSEIRGMIDQATSLYLKGEPGAAEQTYRRAVYVSRAELGPGDDFTLNTRLALCDFLMKNGQHEDAKFERVEIAEILRQKDGFYVIDILELIVEAMVKSDISVSDPDFRRFPIFILRSLEGIFGPMNRVTRERIDDIEQSVSTRHPESDLANLLEQLSFSSDYRHELIHIRTATICGLAEWYQRGVNLHRSRQILENALQCLADVTFLPDELWVSVLSYAGWLEYKRGNNDRALNYLTECLQRQNYLSSDHWGSRAATHRRLANIYWLMGDFTTGLEQCRHVIEYDKSLYGQSHSLVTESLQSIANSCQSQELWANEADILDDLLSILLESDRADEESTSRVAYQLGVALRLCKRLEDAMETLSIAERGFIQQPNPDRRWIGLARIRKADVLEDQGHYKEAEAIKRDLLEEVKKTQPFWEKTDLPYMLEALGCNLVAQNRLQEAVEVLERALTLLELVVNYKKSELSVTFMHLVNALRKQGYADDSPRMENLRHRYRRYREDEASEKVLDKGKPGPVFQAGISRANKRDEPLLVRGCRHGI